MASQYAPNTDFYSNANAAENPGLSFGARILIRLGIVAVVVVIKLVVLALLSGM